MKLSTKLILASSIIGLSACASVETPSENFGAASKHNKSVQFVEPTAEQKANTYIRPDPARTALARDRYRKDDVEQPEDFSTVD